AVGAAAAGTARRGGADRGTGAASLRGATGRTPGRRAVPPTVPGGGAAPGARRGGRGAGLVLGGRSAAGGGPAGGAVGTGPLPVAGARLRRPAGQRPLRFAEPDA